MFSLPGGGFDKLRDRQFNFSLARGSGQATSKKALSGNVMITDPLSYYIYFSTSIPMLIRKNTKAFKTILEIISACREKPDREKLIRLYVTKAGDTIKDRISVEAIEGGAGVFYEMGYQAVVGNLKSSNHQLHQSDEIPGVYFFHSSSNKVWDETPFEFDEAIKKEFGSLPELPIVRKKEKAEKFSFPAPKVKSEGKAENKEVESKSKGKKQAESKLEKKAAVAKESREPKKSAKVVALWPKQPDYNLKHEIHFTGLERIINRQTQLARKDVLDYYNNIAEYFLPYLKDRPLAVRLLRDGQPGAVNTNIESLRKNSPEEIPDWIQTATVGKGKSQEQLLLCNDREHLLFYVQIGCLAFHAGLARIKSLDSPDYLILGIESPDYELAKAAKVAIAANEILTGLQLSSFVKTDGTSGLHVYIPLDSKSDFEACRNVAGYLCRLVQLKIPGVVTIKGSGNHAYGKVSLDFQMNEPGKAVVAPYSLVVDQSANIATPILWQEVTEGLIADSFNPETIFKRLKEEGDPFEALFRKKVNADELLKRLEVNYSFLF